MKKFKWMNLIHPAKFDEQKNALLRDQRILIHELSQLYPFVVLDMIALENNLDVLYNNKEISALLQKLVRERDALVAKKRARRHQSMRANEGTVANQGDGQTDPEENDAFHLREIVVDVDAVKENKYSRSAISDQEGRA